MSWSRIRAIYRKDMRDALRDSRVLTALLFPLALGLVYSFIFPDEIGNTEKIKVGIVSSTPTRLTSIIPREAGRTVDLTFVTMKDEAELERDVRSEEVDIGLVIPPDFDADVRAGLSPVLITVLPSSPTLSGDVAVALLSRSVEALAAQPPPALIERRSLPPETGGDTAVIDVLGARTQFILVATLMLLAMIAVYAVPTVLVEETEKKTMDALTLIASTTDVIAAKALFGMGLSIVGVPVLFIITRADPAAPVPLAVAVALSALVLVGIGLLTTRVFRTQQQVNTWSGVVMLVILAPAFTIGLSAPAIVNKILWLLPSVHTFRLIANAFAGRTLYPGEWLSFGVLIAWALGAYGILWWSLARREDL